MNKNELISFIAGKANLSQADAAKALEAFVSAVMETLKDKGSVSIVGFGAFSVSERTERMGRNPRTGESVFIPASFHPKFRAGKLLRESVNQAEELIE